MAPVAIQGAIQQNATGVQEREAEVLPVAAAGRFAGHDRRDAADVVHNLWAITPKAFSTTHLPLWRSCSWQSFLLLSGCR